MRVFARRSTNVFIVNGVQLICMKDTLLTDRQKEVIRLRKQGMTQQLNEENFGELIDPFGGIRDLEDKIIRTPLDPDITYSDDPLRMMRAIRFATQLNFDIETESFNAIKRNADRIKIISM